MTDFITWVGDVFALEIATVGLVDVTLGILIATSMIFALAVGAAKSLKGRR